MKSKLWFLIKMSLNKKIKTKWFYIANILFLILIVGLINIDTIIKSFGGEFNKTKEILVIDNANVFDNFKDNYLAGNKYISDYDNVEIILYQNTYDKALEEVKNDDKILLIIDKNIDNYLSAKIVSNEELSTITSTLITSSLNNTRTELALAEYHITHDMYLDLNKAVNIEREILDDNNIENSMVISTMMQILILPLFMLIMFLVQMIGAEVNEEKSTKSMEIIISNVSPQTHFISKIISSNTFVLIQSILLFGYVLLGIIVRYFISGGNVISSIEIDNELLSIISTIPLDSITNTLAMMIPIILVMIILTFIAYSLLAGILASMTTNLEDFQQLQTPIMIISLIGYYLSVMSGMFKGSIFIKIMSYFPLISSMLSPTLYVMGEVTIIDLLISILLLIALIYILIKYGLKIYKVGILNYSGNGLWKKMLKAVKEK